MKFKIGDLVESYDEIGIIIEVYELGSKQVYDDGRICSYIHEKNAYRYFVINYDRQDLGYSYEDKLVLL